MSSVELDNTATVSSPTTDPSSANNTATASVDVTAAADLSVAKTLESPPLVPGTDAAYVLTVHNAGPSDATAVTVTDTLPSALTYVSATGGTCSGAGPLTCDLGTIGSGATKVLRIVVAVDPAATGSIANTATVTSASGDPDLSNNTSTATAPTQPQFAVHLTKTVTAHYQAGGSVTFVIKATNDGPSTAAGAHITDPLPATISAASWTCASGCTPASGTGDVDTVADIAPGATVTVTVDATVAADANGAIVNTASVVADGMVESETAEASASPLSNMVRGDVYVDTNHNGVKDPGEPDLSGVTVMLIGPGTDGTFGTADDVVLDSTVTASPFEFADVGAGSFRIAVVTSTLPKGYRATGDNDGDTDSRVDVALAAGHSRTDLEFGYVPPTVDAPPRRTAPAPPMTGRCRSPAAIRTVWS